MEKRTLKRRFRIFAFAFALLISVLMLTPVPSQAGDNYWIGGDGNWTEGSNWSLGTEPQHLDNALLIQDATTVTVTYDTSSNPHLSGVMIDGTNGGSMTLLQGQGALTATYTGVGIYGTGSYTQNDGTHNTYTLYLGWFAGSSGAYDLNGGYLTADAAAVGLRGTGTFTQSGGIHMTGPTYGLFLGAVAGSYGIYDLSGGALMSPYTVVGENGTGTFTQTGGFHAVTVPPGMVVGLVLGSNPGSKGTYTLSGDPSLFSILTVNGNTIVGNNGSGKFIQSGGEHTVSGDVIIAANPGSSGTYNLSGGILTVVGGIVNNDKFNFSGGDLNANITNNATFTVSGGGTRVINGDVINNAIGSIFKIDNTHLFANNISNNGHIDTDPAIIEILMNLIIGPTGYLTGGLGDEFRIGGDFLNYSTNALWNTKDADLFFKGAGPHMFHLSNLVEANTWDELSLLDGAILD